MKPYKNKRTFPLHGDVLIIMTGEEPIYKFLTFDLIIGHLIKIGHEGKSRVICDVLRNFPTTFEKIPCMHHTWRPLQSVIFSKRHCE
jgi:hypothetical protein